MGIELSRGHIRTWVPIGLKVIGVAQTPTSFSYGTNLILVSTTIRFFFKVKGTYPYSECYKSQNIYI